MKSNWIILLISGLIIANVCSPVYARIHFEKLSATEVYRALREAGRLDAVPEGRVVTQGIAAATGFIAGITKGIGIPLLLGLAMPQPSSSNGEKVTTQEICFSSRSIDEIDDDKENNKEYDEDDERENDEPQGRKVITTASTVPTTTSADTPTATTGTNDATGGGTTTVDGDGTGTNTETTTQTGTGGAVNCIIIQKPVKG